MIKKLIPVLVFSLAAVVCTFDCDHVSQGPLRGGVLEPFASGPQFDPTEPESERLLTVPERIYGTSSAPQGGAGLMFKWNF